MREGTNVRIEAREHGKLVAVRDFHNVWTDDGRQYIAEMLGFTSFGPDVPERDDHVEYIGFGMGSISQNQQSMVTSAPLSTVYPIASTPHGTGFAFRHDYSPNVPSLELPVALAPLSTANAYHPAAVVQWRGTKNNASESSAWAAHPATNVFRFYFASRLSSLVFPLPISGNQYHLLPLSEAGLFTSDAPTLSEAFRAPAAYVNFDTIQVSQDTDIFVVWDVTF